MPDLGQLLSLVPPTDYVAPPPELHGPQYRTADWLRAQGGMAWTLLTNRVHPTRHRETGITELRRATGDAVIAAG